MSPLQQHKVSSTTAQSQLYSATSHLMINSPEPSKNSPLKTTTPPAAFVLPDWIPIESWKHFLEMRTAMRKKPTEHAAKLLVAKLDKLRIGGHDPGDVLDQSTANSWAGLFPLKGNENGNPPVGKADRNMAVLAEALARGKRSDGTNPYGLLSAGVDRSNDSRSLYGGAGARRSARLPSGDGNH
jgi:hypothetical protein